MLAEQPKSTKERLEDAIEETRRVSRCRSVAIARRDGLIIVHRLEPGLDPRLAAAMAAATLGAADASAKELRRGKVERVIIECAEGKIVAMDAGPDAIILALYDRDANLGLALHGLARVAHSVDLILTEMR